ncbi:transposase [Streptomyces sp. NPDC001351]|uniref:transposase n=1 Tax=Streptomyces sp. NPDC001351 TaxID=3364564 RepID=UPI00369E8BB4
MAPAGQPACEAAGGASSVATDSQSVKADAVVGADSRGFDGGKVVNGRKRHVVVDSLGLLLGVMVTATDTGNRIAAQVLLGQVAVHHRLELVWADGDTVQTPGRAPGTPPRTSRGLRLMGLQPRLCRRRLKKAGS